MTILDDTMHCPRCDTAMLDLGNLEDSIMLSYPPSWRNTWACHNCKVKITKIVQGTSPAETSLVKDYEEVEEILTPIQKKRQQILKKQEKHND